MEEDRNQEVILPRSNAPALERKLNTLRVLPHAYNVQHVTNHLVSAERRAFRLVVTTRSIVTIGEGRDQDRLL